MYNFYGRRNERIFCHQAKKSLKIFTKDCRAEIFQSSNRFSWCETTKKSNCNSLRSVHFGYHHLYLSLPCHWGSALWYVRSYFCPASILQQAQRGTLFNFFPHKLFPLGMVSSFVQNHFCLLTSIKNQNKTIKHFFKVCPF